MHDILAHQCRNKSYFLKAYVIKIHKRLVCMKNAVEYFSEKNREDILGNQNEMRSFLGEYIVLELRRI